MRRARGLKVIIRPDTGTLWIEGTIGGQRIRRRAQSNIRSLAEEEARLLEAELLRTEWHGERRGDRFFPEAVTAYIEAEERSDRVLAQIERLVKAVAAATKLMDINQAQAVKLKKRLLKPGTSEATYLREIIAPLRAIMMHAHRLGWCDAPYFKVPKGAVAEGRTLYLLPNEAERLIAAAATHRCATSLRSASI